jgi:hypothetical protein
VRGCDPASQAPPPAQASRKTTAKRPVASPKKPAKAIKKIAPYAYATITAGQFFTNYWFLPGF